MKTKVMMLLVLLTLTGSVLAQGSNQQKEEPKEVGRTGVCSKMDYVSKFFPVKHHSTNFLAEALKGLIPDMSIIPNQSLKILTVRGCPGDVAAFETMLARLDVSEQAPASMEFQLHLLAASVKAVEGGAIPKQLEPVVAQLKNTLKYANYRYVYSAINRISNGGRVESSGVTGELFPAPAAVANTPANPSFYQYLLHNVKFTQDATGKDSVQIEQFRFGISVPIQTGGGVQYKDIGLTTPLSLREGEIAVVGTANISGSDEAMIVVVSVKKLK